MSRLSPPSDFLDPDDFAEPGMRTKPKGTHPVKASNLVAPRTMSAARIDPSADPIEPPRPARTTRDLIVDGLAITLTIVGAGVLSGYAWGRWGGVLAKFAGVV